MIKKFFSRPATQVHAPRWGPWHCAGYSFLVLASLMAFNLAGCGGGGSSRAVPTANVRIDLRNTSGDLVTGTVRLKGVNTSYDTTLNAPTGIVTFSGVRSGNYLVTVTYDTGSPSTQTDDISIGSDRNQTFVAVQGVTGIPGAGIRVTGRIFSGTPGCTSTSFGLAAQVLVRVRKINPSQGNPIVATFVKPFQSTNAGTYSIFNIPGTGTYIVEVRQAPATDGGATAPFCGQSRSFFVGTTDTTISNIDICANADACVVGGTPPPPPGTPVPTTGGGGPPLP